MISESHSGLAAAILRIAPKAVVVMGVSGCGKSTLRRNLAESVGYLFIEGDQLHSRENRQKMASGAPLSDADRWPSLETIGQTLRGVAAAGAVAACSALRRSYRTRIRSVCGGDVLFVFIDLDRPSLIERLQGRKGHFMPIGLLDSQLETLERPDAEEGVVIVDGHLAPLAQLCAVLHQLREWPAK